jgi:hypothetical protein
VQVNRKEIIRILTLAAAGYWYKKKYSVHSEIGIVHWGRSRADLLCINLKGDVVISEVKSCWNDFITDNKWIRYLDHCNRFYFVISQALWISHKHKFIEHCKPNGAGVMMLDESTGWVKVVRPASKRHVKKQVILNLTLRMTWRYGESARTHRRKRYYLETSIIGEYNDRER